MSTDNRWTIKVSEETDRGVRTYLAQHGAKKGGLSRFVEEAVEERLYHLMVNDIQERNKDLSEQEIENLVDEAVRWARTGR
ncbi:MAG TPA: ribbon-helix-helix domain-containing protein [Trueperaceae bacterium]|nr:ribbon-helix-helix domain-containing protein [Trueperaceae bacterium]